MSSSFFTNLNCVHAFTGHITNTLSKLQRWRHGDDNPHDTLPLNAFNENNTRHRNLHENNKNIIFDPSQKYYYYWLAVCFLAFLYNFIFVIMRISFRQFQEIDSWFIWIIFDYAFSDLVYIFDIFCKFRTGFMKDGELCKDLKQIRIVYMKSINFKFDVLSVLPLDLFYFALPNAYKEFYPVLRLNKLMKFSRYKEFLIISETRTKFPNLLRMCNLIGNILLLIHWNGCIYFLISYIIGFGNDIWVYPAFIDENILANYTQIQKSNMLIPNELATQYIFCFWWSTLTLTAIAEITQPNVHYEEIYTSFLLIFGLAVVAIVIASTGAMFDNANSQRIQLQINSDKVKLFLRKYKIDKKFEKRIDIYIDYLWSNPNVSSQQDSVLDSLPDELNCAIAMNLHMETLKRVIIFQDCEPGVLRDLVTKLKLKLFSPGDYVCRKGDIGREMYFIKSGKLEVVSEDGKRVFATLNAGASFGEISILDIPGNKNGNRRTANIRSVGFSDLFQLTKDDLWDVLSEYPLAKGTLMEKGKALLRKDNILDEELAEKIERRQQTAYAQLDKLEICFEKLNKRFDDTFKLYVEFLQKTKQQVTLLEAKIEDLTSKTSNDVKIS